MTDVFGDIEPDDLWDADPTVDPLQVAIRLHELRVMVDILAGHDDLARWHDLSEPLQDRLEVSAVIIVDLIAAREPDDPAVLAHRVHEERSLQAWDDLAPDERQIAIDLMTLIVEWLEEQGPR